MSGRKCVKKWAFGQSHDDFDNTPITEREMFVVQGRPACAIKIQQDGVDIKYNARNYAGVFDALLKLAGMEYSNLLFTRPGSKTGRRYITRNNARKLIDAAIKRQPDIINVLFDTDDNFTENDVSESKIFLNPIFPFSAITLDIDGVSHRFSRDNYVGFFDALERVFGSGARALFRLKRNYIHTCRCVDINDFIKFIESKSDVLDLQYRVTDSMAIPMREYQLFCGKDGVYRSITLVRDGQRKHFSSSDFSGFYDILQEIFPQYAHMFYYEISRGKKLQVIKRSDLNIVLDALKNTTSCQVEFKQKSNVSNISAPIETEMSAGKLFAASGHPFSHVKIKHRGKVITFNRDNYTNFYDALIKLAPQFESEFPMRSSGAGIYRYATWDLIERVIEFINAKHPGAIDIKYSELYNPDVFRKTSRTRVKKASVKKKTKKVPNIGKNDIYANTLFTGKNHPYTSMVVNNITYNYLNYGGLFERLREMAPVEYKYLFRSKHTCGRMHLCINQDKLNTVIDAINKTHPGMIKIYQVTDIVADKNDFTECQLFHNENHPFASVTLNGKKYSGEGFEYRGFLRHLTELAGVSYDAVVHAKRAGSKISDYINVNDLYRIINDINMQHPGTVQIIPSNTDKKHGAVSEYSIFHGGNAMFKRVVINGVDNTHVYADKCYKGMFEKITEIAGINLQDIAWVQASGPRVNMHMPRNTLCDLIDKINQRRPGTVVVTPIQKTR